MRPLLLRRCVGAALYALSALASAQPLEVRAPHYGDVLFQFFQERHFEAVTTLMVSQHFGRLGPQADEAEVLRGGLLLSYGLHREAGEIFARLIDGHAAPAVRDRAWFFVARLRQQRGLLADAEAALARIANPLPGELEHERTLLAAQLRLAQGDFAGAAARLQTVPADAAAASAARFNLGVAWIQGGDGARGSALLDALGRAAAGDEEQRHLRDRANVALGFAALAQQRPADARSALQRVRLDGPASNKALLGFGWAAAALQAPQDALVPWTELLARGERDSGDAAVLEARIARPYALAELGALRQALDGYDDALAAYARERRRLAESIAAIRSGALVAALLDHNPSARLSAATGIGSVVAMPHGSHLAALMAGHAFQEAFKNLRDLRFLQTNLQDGQQRLAAFGDMLAHRREAFAKRLPAVREQAGALRLPPLQQRRDALAAELARAEAGQDAAALASDGERALLLRIARVEAALQQQPDAEAAERLRRVKGALTWQLARDWPERLWQAKKALRQADAALADAGTRDAALQRAQADEPARFDGFAARIAALDGRVAALQPRVAALGSEQQAALQEMAVAALEAQQQRLDVYTAQARLAIAQLHDRAQLSARAPEAPDAAR